MTSVRYEYRVSGVWYFSEVLASAWPRVRRELEKAGYLYLSRTRTLP